MGRARTRSPARIDALDGGLGTGGEGGGMGWMGGGRGIVGEGGSGIVPPCAHAGGTPAMTNAAIIQMSMAARICAHAFEPPKEAAFISANPSSRNSIEPLETRAATQSSVPPAEARLAARRRPRRSSLI